MNSSGMRMRATYAAAVLTALFAPPLSAQIIEEVVITASRVRCSEAELDSGFCTIVAIEPPFSSPSQIAAGGIAPTQPDPGNEGKPDPCENATTAHPVVIETGKKVLEHVDFIGAGEMPLSMVRTYHQGQAGGVFLRNWRASIDYSLQFHTALPPPFEWCGGYGWQFNQSCSSQYVAFTAIRASRPNGASYTFTWNAAAGRWKDAKPDSVAWIGTLVNGKWELHTEAGATETYLPSGQVESIVNEQGVSWTFNYAAPAGLQSVVHSSGRSMQFTWESGSVSGSYRLKTVTGPSGQVYSYTYGVGDLLSTVNGPGGFSVGYYYEVPYKPHLLTGYSLGGVRRATYTYYADDRVQRSELAAGYDGTSFSYGTNSTALSRAGGMALNYNYESDGQGGKRLRSITRSGVTNCPNATAETAYDANGFIDYTLDWRGTRTEYLYNAKGQLLEQVRGINSAFPGEERKTVNQWNASTNRLERVLTYGSNASEPLAEVFYEYYATGSAAPNRLQRITSYNRTSNGIPGQARVTSFSYQLHANNLPYRVWVDGPLAGSADTTIYESSSAGDLLKTTNALGQQVTLAGHNGLGLPATVTDPNGAATSFSYNGRGQTLSAQQTVEGVSRLTQLQYGADGLLSQLTRADGTYERYSYSPAGLLLFTSYDQGPSQSYSLNYGYDANGNRSTVSVTGWTLVLVPCLGNPSQFCPQPQLTSVFSQPAAQYDQSGRLISQPGNNGQNAQWQYDNDGNLTQAKDALNRTTTWYYNAHDEPIRSVDALGQNTYFSYDDAGRLQRLTDAKGNVTISAFDGFGNLTSLTSPDTGLTTFTYDEAGRRTSMTRQNGAVTSYGYDVLDRLTSISAGGQTQSFTYDVYTGCSYGAGRLCYMSDSNSSSTTAYAYNAAGELTGATTTINGTAYAVSYTHNAVGKVSSITYPGGNRVLYEYGGPEGKIAAVKTVIAGVTSTVANGFSYQPFGPMTGWRVGGDATKLRSFAYDSDRRLIGMSTPSISGLGGSSTLAYLYSTADEIAQRQETVTGQAAQTQAFGYDALSRLASVTAGIGNQSFTFDANGSRESHTWGGVLDDYVPQAASNRISSIAGSRAKSFSYDSIGNLTAKSGYGGNFSYAHDPFNRLNSFTGSGTTSYLYNALNQRVRKSGPGGGFNYLYGPGAELLAETASGSTAMSTHYVWLNGEPIAMIRNNVLYYLYTDHLGRPEIATTTAHALVWRASNTAYDRTVLTNTIGGINLGFPGQYYDAESQLWYNWNRYYDASTGRYTQPDPIGLVGGLNSHAYAWENPVSFIDSNGLWSVTVEFYRGIGGALIVGQSPTTGGWFGSIRVGFGIGGGIEWDLLDSNPAQEASSADNSCSVSGMGAGLFGNIGANVGPVSAGFEAQVGAYRDSNRRDFYGDFGPEASIGTSWGIRGSVSVGYEQSGWQR